MSESLTHDLSPSTQVTGTPSASQRQPAISHSVKEPGAATCLRAAPQPSLQPCPVSSSVSSWLTRSTPFPKPKCFCEICALRKLLFLKWEWESSQNCALLDTCQLKHEVLLEHPGGFRFSLHVQSMFSSTALGRQQCALPTG